MIPVPTFEQRYHPWVQGAVVVDVQFWRDYMGGRIFNTDVDYVIFTRHELAPSLCRALIREHSLKYAEAEKRRRARLLPVPLCYTPRTVTRQNLYTRYWDNFFVGIDWGFKHGDYMAIVGIE